MTDKLREALERIIALDVPVNIVDVMDSTAREAVEIAKAALAQQDAQAVPQGWQPIETAPLDGTNVLLRWGVDGVSQGHYVPGVSHPWKFIDTNDGITWLINHAVDGPGGPSHWMPMPDVDAAHTPPAQQDAQGVVQEPCAVVKWQTGGPVVHIIGDVQAGDLLYRAAPTPPAQKPLGWLAKEAVECLQGAEMTWMPVWNRQCSSDPVPIFLGPPVVKESLTDQTAPTPPVQEPLTDEQERANFEAFWLSEIGGADDLSYGGLGYVIHRVACSWEAWKARAALAEQPEQRVMLTDEEIEQASVKGDGTHSGFARAVIAAYETKNGLKP